MTKIAQNAYNKRPADMKVGDLYGYKIVAEIYGGITWAAYRGLTDWNDEEVASNGDKIDYKAARLLFPTIDQLYRWNY